jgi:hypothetical protein
LTTWDKQCENNLLADLLQDNMLEKREANANANASVLRGNLAVLGKRIVIGC